jgi:hypothetical protein
MHSAALGRKRAERVTQALARDPAIRDYAGYVPVDAGYVSVDGAPHDAWQGGA